MTLTEQGAYRNLLDELWLREGILPDDERVLAKISGDALEWPKIREKVLSRFEKTKDGYRHGTHDEVAGQSKRRAVNQKRYRERMSKPTPSDNATDNKVDNKPDSPSPSPSPSPLRTSPTYILPPADRTERALRLSTDALRTKLYALIDEAASLDPKQRDQTELIRLFTSYEKEGRSIRGVTNAGLLSHERLEKSIADAEGQIAEWKGAKVGA